MEPHHWLLSLRYLAKIQYRVIKITTPLYRYVKTFVQNLSNKYVTFDIYVKKSDLDTLTVKKNLAVSHLLGKHSVLH